MIYLIRALRLPGERFRPYWSLIAAYGGPAALRSPAALRNAAALTDQVIVSGTNFLTTLVIGRVCLPEQLGLYSMGFSLFVLLMGIPKALVWTPYTTFLPPLAPQRAASYSGSVLLHQISLSALLGLATSAAGMAMSWHGGSDLGHLLTVLGPVVGLMLFREHIRRMCFARLQVGQALLLDVAIAVLQAGGILALAAADLLTASRAYWVLGLACLPTALVWCLHQRATMSWSRQHAQHDLLRNWRYARWVFAAALAHAASDALYPWALSGFHGMAAVGMLSAAGGVIFLTNPLILGVGNMLAPQAAHTFAAEGMQGLQRLTVMASVALILAIALFTALVAVWGELGVTLLFGNDYAEQGHVVTSLAVGQLADVATIPLSLALLATHRGDFALKTYLIRLGVTATAGLYCVWQFGAAGVGYGQTASYLAAGAWQVFAFRQLVRDSAMPPEASS